MRRLALLFSFFPLTAAWAHREEVPGPDPGARRFGADLVVLPNGNYLVTDPGWSAGAGADDAGAVYLYSAEGNLLSRLTGSVAGDRVGSGGIVVLASGHFVVQSPHWHAAGAIEDAGAVTWGDADIGVGAAASVGADNSLVGSSVGDAVGLQPVVPLANGSYVVASGMWDRIAVAVNAGAVTWGAADGSIVGPLSSANSLVGSQAEDHVGDWTSTGTPGVIALGSGHYVVTSPLWNNGGVADAGAVTWASDDGAVVGAVTVANSLVGAQASDQIGSEVQALANNDHYIVQSWLWDDGATQNVGAVTWADGTQASTGTVSALNSLIGSQSGDRVGYLAAVLTNGHYVVASPFWNNGAVQFTGAATWRDGSGPHPGVVSPGNSLVGTRFGDTVGYFTNIGIPPLGVVPLPQGDYVVASPEWNRSQTLTKAGALTWGDGDGGTQGPVDVANSLVGAAAGDAIAQYVTVLENGDYVVASPYWSQRRGAATWGDGQAPLVGVVGAENSLVGERTTDFVTAYGIYPLPDGGYAVPVPQWSRQDAAAAGAVTRAPPDGGIAGLVSAQNSFTGTGANELASSGGLLALPDGDLLVRSALASGLGGLTRIPVDATPASFTIGAANSLTGMQSDRIGGPGPSLTTDGAIVAFTASIAADGAGAITLFGPDDPFRGALPGIDTVRSAAANGGPSMNHAYLAPSATLLVGDPAGNRIVRMTRDRLFHDDFE